MFVIILLMITNTKAQSIERQIIGSVGTTVTDRTSSLDFTVDELAITTITDETITLTQGFHQAYVVLGIKINPIVFLQGAALNPNTGEESLMRDDLRVNYVPVTSPYIDALTCDVSVFADGGTSGTGLMEDNIVDWIYVELSDKTDNTLVKGATSALLQRDGDIVTIDGVSDLEIPVKSDDYHIVVNYRNHLGIMAVNTIVLTSTVTSINFSDVNNRVTYGTNAQTTFGMPTDKVAMWAGDASGNGQIRFLGPGNDLNNLKGFIRYQGSGNDTNILKDIILSHPGNQTSPSNLFMINEQVPQN